MNRNQDRITREFTAMPILRDGQPPFTSTVPTDQFPIVSDENPARLL